jgi:hypothetical protein
MSERAPVHQEIFLFVLGNSKDKADNGYAKVMAAFRRKSPGNWKEAWEEIKQLQVPTLWGTADTAHCPGGIDMAFGTGQPCLVFVAIDNPGASHPHDAAEDRAIGPLHHVTTYFGDKIVAPLPIRGIPDNLITDPMLHLMPNSKYPTVCSFVLGATSASSEGGSPGEASTLARFPIVFDFVDSDDGRSPALKKPSGSKRSASPETEFPMLNHGGIHPPNGASMIEFFE